MLRRLAFSLFYGCKRCYKPFARVQRACLDVADGRSYTGPKRIGSPRCSGKKVGGVAQPVRAAES
jgi:hypothetical protein